MTWHIFRLDGGQSRWVSATAKGHYAADALKAKANDSPHNYPDGVYHCIPSGAGLRADVGSSTIGTNPSNVQGDTVLRLSRRTITTQEVVVEAA